MEQLAERPKRSAASVAERNTNHNQEIINEMLQSYKVQQTKIFRAFNAAAFRRM